MDKIKFKPFIVTKDTNGNILLTEEKLQELLEQAYNYGYTLGSSKVVISSPSVIPLNGTGTNPVWDPYKITCTSVSGVNNGQST